MSATVHEAAIAGCVAAPEQPAPTAPLAPRRIRQQKGKYCSIPFPQFCRFYSTFLKKRWLYQTGLRKGKNERPFDITIEIGANGLLIFR